ncbi:energy-coupling factor transporter transmembrane component T family protein [Mycoplasmopsis gallinarum]
MNTPFGSYSNNNTFVHRLDARLKLIVNILIIIMAFFSDYFFSMFLIMIPVMTAYLIATKSFKALLKSFRMPLLIGIFIFFINVYTMKINDPIIQTYEYVWQRQVYWDIYKGIYGIYYGTVIRTVALILRIYTMILATSLLVMTTKPVLLTKAIEDLLWPLKLLFIPVHIIAMIISITLRFIPTLLDEAQRIIKAQASRGIDFRNGKIKEKARSFTTLIIPLFVISFSRAEDLSNAMETRGYDPYEKRTRYRSLKWEWQDYLIFILFVGLLIFIIVSQSKYVPDFLPTWYKITKSNF